MSNKNIFVENIVDNTYYNLYELNLFRLVKSFIKSPKLFINKRKKLKKFKLFNQYIEYSGYVVNNDKYDFNINSDYDYFIVGSDQVWNPNFAVSDIMLLKHCPKDKCISYAASFGVNNILNDLKNYFADGINDIKFLSVREDIGKDIIYDLIGRKDVEVLVDPTMLLTDKEWDMVSKKPTMLKNNKYILNYFLGNLSEERKKEIERIADENNCEIINILDKNSPFYECGPSEFLWLEKNAFLICTDSFHSSVFGLLFNRPFIIFDREDKEEKMNSRLDTLINKFKLKNRKFEGRITEENLNHDYSEAYKILEEERKKSEAFLKKALEIKE